MFLKSAAILSSKAHVSYFDLLFQGFKCDENAPNMMATFVIFSFYVVVTAWVVMVSGAW